MPAARCLSCGFRFATLSERYDFCAAYRTEAAWSGYESYWRSTERFYRARLRRLSGFRRPARLLEIGCADGRFLKMAQLAGWKVSGVEISDPMRRRCTERINCELFGSLAEATAARHRFDCVVLFEVLEHLPDPLATLSQVRLLMEREALLAVSTPNFEGRDARARPEEFFVAPFHISYFGPRTLTRCIEDAGFRVLKLNGLFTTGELPLPLWLARTLMVFRRGKRLRPRGLVGKLIKAYQRRHASDEYWRAMEAYARKVC